MKNTMSIIITGILLTGWIQLSQAQNISIQQKAMIEQQVDSIFKSMVHFAEALDFDKLNTGVDDSQQAGFISNGVYYHRYDSLVAAVKTNARNLKNQTLNINKQKITVLSESIVLLNATGEAMVEPGNGNIFSATFFGRLYTKKSMVFGKSFNHTSLVKGNQLFVLASYKT